MGVRTGLVKVRLVWWVGGGATRTLHPARCRADSVPGEPSGVEAFTGGWAELGVGPVLGWGHWPVVRWTDEAIRPTRDEIEQRVTALLVSLGVGVTRSVPAGPVSSHDTLRAARVSRVQSYLIGVVGQPSSRDADPGPQRRTAAGGSGLRPASDPRISVMARRMNACWWWNGLTRPAARASGCPT